MKETTNNLNKTDRIASLTYSCAHPISVIRLVSSFSHIWKNEPPISAAAFDDNKIIICPGDCTLLISLSIVKQEVRKKSKNIQFSLLLLYSSQEILSNSENRAYIRNNYVHMCLGSREPKEQYETVLEKKKSSRIPGATDRPKPAEGPLN